MTTNQRNAILAMDETQLRKQISVLSSSDNKDKDELINACENQLDSMCVDDAMVEQTDMSDMGNFS